MIFFLYPCQESQMSKVLNSLIILQSDKNVLQPGYGKSWAGPDPSPFDSMLNLLVQRAVNANAARITGAPAVQISLPGIRMDRYTFRMKPRPPKNQARCVVDHAKQVSWSFFL